MANKIAPNIQTPWVAVLLLVGAVHIIGCGSSSVVFNPDFKNADLHVSGLKQDSVRILSVTDQRAKPTTQIGTARTGMMNREVPYLVKGNLANVVQEFLDTLIVARHDEDRFFPIRVSIEQFEVGEKHGLFGETGFFNCHLRFLFPVTPDSIGVQDVVTKQSAESMVDVTDNIEPLIYKGMAAAAREFVGGTLNTAHRFVTVEKDSAEKALPRDTSVVVRRLQPVATAQKPVSGADSNSTSSAGATIQVFAGNKIKTGVRISYSQLRNTAGSDFRWGMSFGLTIDDIDNRSDFSHQYLGTLITGGGTLMGRYYLSRNNVAPYVAGRFGLIFGSETIDSGSESKSSFFFGPVIEEAVGIALGKSFSIELGSYQIALMGSNMLPADIGLGLGLNIGL